MELKPTEYAMKKTEHDVNYDLAFKDTFLVLSCPYTGKTWEIWKTTDLKGKKVLVRTDQQEAWVKKTNGIPVEEKKISEKAAPKIIAIDKKTILNIHANTALSEREKDMRTINKLILG